MTRIGWTYFNATAVTIMSLIAAAYTGNENWPMNIPLGLAVGALWGSLSWPIFFASRRWYLRRHCYDKFWRCPGWAGGGWRSPRRQRCAGGSLLVPDSWNRDRTAVLPPDRWWRWRWHRCRKCDVVTLPVAVQWIDPTWWAWKIRCWRRNRRQ